MNGRRQRFFLKDTITGESRDVVTVSDGTEQDARDLLGGSWTDRRRVVCHGPSPIETAD